MNMKGLLLTLGLLSVLGVSASTGCTRGAAATTSGAEADAFASAVASVNRNATSVEVTQWATEQNVTLTRGEPDFARLVQLVSASTTHQVTNKSTTAIENGKPTTIFVTVPYALGNILAFKMKDGTEVKFNCTSDNVWFETDQAIYQASVSPELRPLLERLLK